MGIGIVKDKKQRFLELSNQKSEKYKSVYRKNLDKIREVAELNKTNKTSWWEIWLNRWILWWRKFSTFQFGKGPKNQ